jgi:hypothetical protein
MDLIRSFLKLKVLRISDSFLKQQQCSSIENFWGWRNCSAINSMIVRICVIIFLENLIQQYALGCTNCLYLMHDYPCPAAEKNTALGNHKALLEFDTYRHSNQC